MRSFVTAMGLAFYRGECLFIPKEGTRRLAPMNAATLDPITSLQPKDRLQAFADTCDDAIADKRRIDEAVALFDYTATHTGKDVWPWAVPLMEGVFSAVLATALASRQPFRRRFYAVFLALHAHGASA